MSVSEVESAQHNVDDARALLLGKLSDAVTPGVDLSALVDALDEYIVARVNLMKFDY